MVYIRYMRSPYYPASVVLFQLPGGCSVSHIIISNTSSVHKLNAWIHPTDAILVLATCS